MAVLLAARLLFGLIGLNPQDISGLLLLSAITGFSGSLIALIMSKSSAKQAVGAYVIRQPRNETEDWLVRVVEAQAKQWNLQTPEVAVYESPEPNAFATGASRNSSLVAVSTGLLQLMSRDEVEAVLAHEMAHVSNAIQTIVSMVLQVVFGWLAGIIVMWFSRQREYRADAGAAKLVGAPKMICALQRLKGSQSSLPPQMAAMGINDSTLRSLFSTHPTLDDRIARLQRLNY